MTVTMRERDAFLACLGFLSRIPVPMPAGAALLPLAESLHFAPVAGVVVALAPALALGIGAATGVPPLVTAAIAVAFGGVMTGALHEDGLADLVDGFGGGRDQARKLAIMRDSRIGTFGALALGTSVLVRVGCLAAVASGTTTARAVGLLVAAAAVSRVAMLLPLALLGPARPDGLARGAGAVGTRTLAIALVLGLAIGTGAWGAAGGGLGRLMGAAAAALAVAAGTTALAHRQVGGVTGDVVGATQQASEMALMVVLSAGAAVMP